MRAVLLRSLAVIAAGGLVLAAVLFVASTVDARAPTVLEIRLTAPLPEDDRRALITTSIEIAFSEPVEPDGAEDAVHLEPDVPGAVSWSGSTLTFTPTEPLRLESAYRLVVDEGIRDQSGNELTEPPPPFEFETAGRPQLVSSDPVSGHAEVPLDAPIALTFATLMDTASVESALRVVPAFARELRWRGEVLEIVPLEPLEPGTEYEISIGRRARDAAGVTIGEPIRLGFRTVAPGLAPRTLVPADGVDGVAPISPIAVFFDRPIDPASVDGDLLTITPDVAGTLEVVALPDEPTAAEGAGSLLRFIPSAPLPPNTTFEVELTASPTTAGGGALTEPLRWSFTTGAPSAAISNAIAFMTDRSGVSNVWVMNPDGTGQRQVSAELTPVLDYAVAPDGSSLVVSDGRRLIYLRPDGTDRRVLTDDGVLEFDPVYRPDGERVAFARADAGTGEGLGLWEWEVGGGDPIPVELPDEPAAPTASGATTAAAALLRAPRYAPDGNAIAFVDHEVAVGILDLVDEELIRVPFSATAPPAWLPDGRSLLLTGQAEPGDARTLSVEAPVGPLEPDGRDAIHQVLSAGASGPDRWLGAGSRVLAIGADGAIALARAGLLHVVAGAAGTPGGSPLVDEPVADAAFAPGGDALVVALVGAEGGGSIELFDLQTEARIQLAEEGSRPRWLP